MTELQLSLRTMKRYIRFACLLYFAILAGVMFSWTRSPTEQFQQTHTKEDIAVKVDQKNFVGKNLRIGTRSGDKDQGYNFSQSWHWNDTTPVDYASNISRGKVFCGSSYVGFDHNFAMLTNVILDPRKSEGRPGGEDITQVLNQPEKKEYYILDEGYFAIQCLEDINYTFHLKSHLNNWQKALITYRVVPNYSVKWHEWTIAVTRYEYANLYHTMTDLYNAFLVAKVFKMEPGNITILWIDGHPKGALDKVWKTLFGKVLRAGDINQPTMFSHMVWGIMGYHSVLNKHNNRQVPYLDEFRSFFLQRHGVSKQSHLNCAKLKIVFIWRRDYLAHPRKPSGSLTRKIKNEDELLNSIKAKFPRFEVTGVQIDKFDMKRQLEMVADTDILVGMHGAGLSHLLFLPNYAGVVELFPLYWSTSNKHFSTFAKRRNIHYLSWQNTDITRELPNHYTLVDVTAVTNLISQMVKKICS